MQEGQAASRTRTAVHQNAPAAEWEARDLQRRQSIVRHSPPGTIRMLGRAAACKVATAARLPPAREAPDTPC
jgi:hypothetical protein